MQVAGRSLGEVTKNVVTKERACLLPLLAAAAAANPVSETRRSLMQLMVTAIPKPMDDDREVIVQVCRGCGCLRCRLTA